MHTDANVGDTGGRSRANGHDEGDLQRFRGKTCEEMIINGNAIGLTGNGFIRRSAHVVWESKPSVLSGISTVRVYRICSRQKAY